MSRKRFRRIVGDFSIGTRNRSMNGHRSAASTSWFCIIHFILNVNLRRCQKFYSRFRLQYPSFGYKYDTSGVLSPEMGWQSQRKEASLSPTYEKIEMIHEPTIMQMIVSTRLASKMCSRPTLYLKHGYDISHQRGRQINVFSFLGKLSDLKETRKQPAFYVAVKIDSSQNVTSVYNSTG